MAPEHPVLHEAELHVWRINLHTEDASRLARARAVLSVGEIAQADRLVLEPARCRCLLGHAALRTVLSRYTQIPPRQITFRYGPHGKPSIDHDGLEFNLSHSGSMGLVAVMRRTAVGIDIEEINERHAADAIATRFFSEAEQAAYRAFPAEERQAAFFRCWSRKEAVIKALGEGLACPLGSFDVSLDAYDARLLALRRDRADISAWTMFTIEAHPGYAAAAAVIGSCRSAAGYDALNIVA